MGTGSNFTDFKLYIGESDVRSKVLYDDFKKIDYKNANLTEG